MNEQDRSQKKWAEEAEEALNRTAEALRAAWEDTREARMSTLEAAKEAVTRLTKAIDQGIEAARQSWKPPGEGSEMDTDTEGTEPASISEEE